MIFLTLSFLKFRRAYFSMRKRAKTEPVEGHGFRKPTISNRFGDGSVSKHLKDAQRTTLKAVKTPGTSAASRSYNG
jgi:hypothetical protein